MPSEKYRKNDKHISAAAAYDDLIINLQTILLQTWRDSIQIKSKRYDTANIKF